VSSAKSERNSRAHSLPAKRIGLDDEGDIVEVHTSDVSAEVIDVEEETVVRDKYNTRHELRPTSPGSLATGSVGPNKRLHGDSESQEREEHRQRRLSPRITASRSPEMSSPKHRKLQQDGDGETSDDDDLVCG